MSTFQSRPNDKPFTTDDLNYAIEHYPRLGAITEMLADGAMPGRRTVGLAIKHWGQQDEGPALIKALIHASKKKPTTDDLYEAVEDYANLGVIKALIAGGAVADPGVLVSVVKNWGYMQSGVQGSGAATEAIIQASKEKPTPDLLRDLLRYAVENYDSDVVKALVAGGAVPDQETINSAHKNWANLSGREDLFKVLSEAAENNKPAGLREAHRQAVIGKNPSQSVPGRITTTMLDDTIEEGRADLKKIMGMIADGAIPGPRTLGLAKRYWGQRDGGADLIDALTKAEARKSPSHMLRIEVENYAPLQVIKDLIAEGAKPDQQTMRFADENRGRRDDSAALIKLLVDACGKPATTPQNGPMPR